MTEQLALLDVAPAPKLTDRQQAVLDALQAAGADGLEASEAGALLHELKTDRWQHSRDQRCRFCGQDGTSVLKALAKKGLTRYRRKTATVAGAWLTTSPSAPSHEVAKPEADGAWTPDEPVPYNRIPF